MILQGSYVGSPENRPSWLIDLASLDFVLYLQFDDEDDKLLVLVDLVKVVDIVVLHLG